MGLICSLNLNCAAFCLQSNVTLKDALKKHEWQQELLVVVFFLITINQNVRLFIHDIHVNLVLEIVTVHSDDNVFVSGFRFCLFVFVFVCLLCGISEEFQQDDIPLLHIQTERTTRI